MSCVLVSPPAAEPLSTADAKSFLRVDHTADDTLIDALVKSAREYVEQWTSRAFINQTWDLRLDTFPPCIRLPKAPIQSVTYIQYVDDAGATQTLDESIYQVDLSSTPSRIVPVYGQIWPSVRCQLSAVTVRFVAGHGANAAAVVAASGGPSLLQALRFAVKHFYDNRDTVITGAPSAEVPLTLRHLVLPHKVW